MIERKEKQIVGQSEVSEEKKNTRAPRPKQET